jgi:hypothetical protein
MAIKDRICQGIGPQTSPSATYRILFGLSVGAVSDAWTAIAAATTAFTAVSPATTDWTEATPATTTWTPSSAAT